MNKVILALVAAFSLFSNTARGQNLGARLTMQHARIDSEDLTLRAERGRAMSQHGAAATILGALQITAAIGMGVGSYISTRGCEASPSCGGDVGLFAGALTFAPLGIIALTAGVPMWVYGVREERRAQVQLSASGATVRF